MRQVGVDVLTFLEYRKSSVKPPRALFEFGHSKGERTREGGLVERGRRAFSKS